MIKQLLLALALTVFTVLIHAVGSVYAVLPAAGIANGTSRGRFGAAVVPLTRLISGLLILHVLEVSIWAGVFCAVGVLPDFEASLYFSMTSYTTVGYGDVIPPESWRLLGPIEAAVGILMFGWSTGFIVAAVQKTFGSRGES